MKMARKISNGEHYLEVPARHWDLFLNCWEHDHTHPTPMPEGHRMFRHPREYGVQVFDVDDGMLIDSARTVTA